MALATSRQTRAHVGSSDPVGRPASEFYSTPPEATRALLSVEPITGPVWEPACGAGDISRELEAAGLQVVSTDLYAAIYLVEDTNNYMVLGACATRQDAQVCAERAVAAARDSGGWITITEKRYDYGAGGIDFLTCEVPPAIVSIVTNPPFSLAEQFAERAVALMQRTGGTVALMQRLAWLETPGRAALFARTGLSHVWVLSRRIPLMHRPGYAGSKAKSSIPFAWYVWRAGHTGDPTVGFVDWKRPNRQPAQRSLFTEGALA